MHNKKCQLCGQYVKMKTQWKNMRVSLPYDGGRVDVRVPVRKCPSCLFEYTDWVADELIEMAKQEGMRRKLA